MDIAKLEEQWPKIAKAVKDTQGGFEHRSALYESGDVERARNFGIDSLDQVRDSREWFRGARWAMAGVLFTLAEGHWPKTVGEEVFALDFIQAKLRSEAK